MALVLVWSVARLVMDSPVELRDAARCSTAPAGPTAPAARQAADPVPVVLTAAGGGAHVVVRDGAGEVVFTGNLAFGETEKLDGPRRCGSSRPTAPSTVGHRRRGRAAPLGEPGVAGQGTFVAR